MRIVQASAVEALQVTHSPSAFFVKDDRLMLFALKKLKFLLRSEINGRALLDDRGLSLPSVHTKNLCMIARKEFNILTLDYSQQKFLFWFRNGHNWCRNLFKK